MSEIIIQMPPDFSHQAPRGGHFHNRRPLWDQPKVQKTAQLETLTEPLPRREGSEPLPLRALFLSTCVSASRALVCFVLLRFFGRPPLSQEAGWMSLTLEGRQSTPSSSVTPSPSPNAKRLRVLKNSETDRLRLLMDEEAIQKLAIGSYRRSRSDGSRKQHKTECCKCVACVSCFPCFGRFQWPIMVPAVMPKYNVMDLGT